MTGEARPQLPHMTSRHWCTPRFYILGTAELIVLKFVTRVEIDMICGFDKAIGTSVHVRTYSLSRNNRFCQPGSDRSVPTSLRAPGSPVAAQVEGQRQRRGE